MERSQNKDRRQKHSPSQIDTNQAHPKKTKRGLQSIKIRERYNQTPNPFNQIHAKEP